MKRDNTIDKTIIRILNNIKIIQKYAIKNINTKKKKEELHFRGISKAVAELHRPITDHILDLHLDMLVKWKIIERDKKPSFNHATFYRLVRNTKWAFEMGMSIKVKSGRGGEFFLLHEKQGDRNKKVYLLLMSLLTIGFTVPQPVNISDVRPGDIYFENKPHRFSDSIPGISISDLFDEYRDSANGWRFRYLTFKNHQEIKWYLNKLMEFEPPIIRPINEIEWIKRERLEKNLEWPLVEKGKGKEEEETIRYGIADKQLHEFLDRCIVLLDSTERLMNHIWKYKRKPKHDEIAWYSFIYGKAYTNSTFIEINQNRNWLKKLIGKTSNQRKKVENDVKAAHKFAEQTGDFKSLKYKTACMIEEYLAGNDRVNRIKKFPQKVHQRYFGGENYEDVYEKYGIIASAIKEIAYPYFINELSLKDE